MASDGRKQPAASVVSAKDITVAEFRDALARYPSVVGAISEAKGGTQCHMGRLPRGKIQHVLT